MNVIDLGGHSGCTILLCEENGVNWVRKVSKDIDYNGRLERQCKKQAEFPCGLIKVPKVTGQGLNENGLFYFDMEYIQGVTLAEYIKTMEIGKIRNVVNMIVDGFLSMSDLSEGADAAIFTEKIGALEGQLKNHNNPIIDKSIEILKEHDWSKFSRTVCHGDLTLENIIIRDGEIYLIDFLDSFYDSWILDIGTLLQDVQVLWSYRFNEKVSMNTVMRLIVFRDLLLDKVREKASGYEKDIYFALLLKLIRIFPYTEDTHTYEFLNKKTEMVMSIIGGME